MALIPCLEKNEVEEIAKQVYEKFERETGKVPEWVKVMAHSPKILIVLKVVVTELVLLVKSKRPIIEFPLF